MLVTASRSACTKALQAAAWLACAVLAACDRPVPPGPAPSAPAPTAAASRAAVTPPIGGVDLSNWQGKVDFAQLKGAGTDYVFIKASQGSTVADPDYRANIQAARAAGLAAGSYHYYVTSDTPQAQFANFSAQVSSLQPGDLPPVVDIEKLNGNSSAELAAALKQFLGLVEQRYGVKPIIYSGESFANQYLSGFSAYPLWLAEYSRAAQPQLPLDWTTWTFWQYNRAGRVAGVEGVVDLDRFNGTAEQFEAVRIR
jgi:lysozyme